MKNSPFERKILAVMSQGPRVHWGAGSICDKLYRRRRDQCRYHDRVVQALESFVDRGLATVDRSPYATTYQLVLL